MATLRETLPQPFRSERFVGSIHSLSPCIGTLNRTSGLESRLQPARPSTNPTRLNSASLAPECGTPNSAIHGGDRGEAGEGGRNLFYCLHYYPVKLAQAAENPLPQRNTAPHSRNRTQRRRDCRKKAQRAQKNRPDNTLFGFLCLLRLLAAKNSLRKRATWTDSSGKIAKVAKIQSAFYFGFFALLFFRITHEREDLDRGCRGWARIKIEFCRIFCVHPRNPRDPRFIRLPSGRAVFFCGSSVGCRVSLALIFVAAPTAQIPVNIFLHNFRASDNLRQTTKVYARPEY